MSPPATPDNLTRTTADSSVDAARSLFAELCPGPDEDPLCALAQGTASIVAGLELQPQLVAAALLYPLVEGQHCEVADIHKRLGAEVADLVANAAQMPRLEHLGPGGLDPSGDHEQAENIRKMLLSMVRDIRAMVIRLAEQLYCMRGLKDAPQATRHQAAQQTRQIYAPLAARLGIWQVKWELEDLAFRYLEPDAYHGIARYLRERRSEREAYIESVMGRLGTELEAAGIRADIRGRPKHIYSIWRKMQRKGVDFEHLYDVLAVRVLVDSVAECYAVLGVVHGLWKHIPREFDDYIATPKDNFYRSLHTAVIGPQDKPVEIQIRTRDMHNHAELGIAAHWRYKEGGAHDPALEQKIHWLRQILESSGPGRDSDFIDQFQSELFEDRVYAFTPRGQVIDLPSGSTPLDFAYHIHTDIGHRCRGARVNGRMVPLTHKLANGDTVEIVTAKQATPSRDWLIPQQGYLASARARAKVKAWFRQQDYGQNVAQGRDLLEREFHRLGVSDVPLEPLAQQFGKSLDDFLAALGNGDITPSQVAGRLQTEVATTRPVRSATKGRVRRQKPSDGGVHIQGVGNLMTHFGRCCSPVPGEPILGYITLGRGVTIHRSDCANALRLARQNPDRLVEVEWGRAPEQGLPVTLNVRAWDRQGLLRDITAMMSHEKVNIGDIRTRLDARHGVAEVDLTVDVEDLGHLSRLLHGLTRLPNVIEARRRGDGNLASGNRSSGG
ncbi:MAG: GTP diphosphokinase [Gammaproteobacteria bacterium]|jgi:GTP pyrophosphokinase